MCTGRQTVTPVAKKGCFADVVWPPIIDDQNCHFLKHCTHGKLDSFQVPGSSGVNRRRSALQVLNARLWKDATRSHCHVGTNVHTEGLDGKFRGTKTQVSETLVDNSFIIDVWGFTGHVQYGPSSEERLVW